MEYKNMTLEVSERIATITLNRPASLNAFNPALKRELEAALDEIGSNNDIWGVIITGNGRAFSSGTDISEFPETVEQARKTTAWSQALFNRVEELEKPVIAAVNGFALGGGLELALCCDIRVAAEGVKLGFPEVKIGAIPCYGGTQRLTRMIGEGRAKEMIYTGEMIRAEQAFRWGLVNEVVPAGKELDKAREILMRILNNSPVAVNYAKQCVNGGLSGGLKHGLDLERDLVSMLVATYDMQEGTRAFLEKRAPAFENR